MINRIVTKVDIPGFEWKSGKVRDRALVDSFGKGTIVFVTTDRISAFDEVLPTAIPEKGRILNQLSIFWMRLFEPVVPNHLVAWIKDNYLPFLGQLSSEQVEVLKERTILAKRAKVIPIECVPRGYLYGSYWQDYSVTCRKYLIKDRVPVYGHWLPSGLKEAEELEFPIFTATTKAPQGHDINLNYGEMEDYLRFWLDEYPEIKELITARLLAQNLKSTSLTIYLVAREYARQRGIIIADTKFEFGFIDNELCLIDEVLTPDSSRFWDAAAYQPGGTQLSYDKQPVRDWLEKTGWNKESPAPELPEEVVVATTERYREAYRRLTGRQ